MHQAGMLLTFLLMPLILCVGGGENRSWPVRRTVR
jgi:hypothetical protein